MSMSQLQTELLRILSSDKTKQKIIIQQLDELVRNFGLLNIEKWRHISNNKSALLHVLVEKELPEVIRHVVREYKLNIDVRRDSDGVTPLQLAENNQNSDICDLLKELGAKDIQQEDVMSWSVDEDKEKSMNIVWVDLEMTSIEEPEILECAVIVTDKDLHELEKNNWVIHFDKSVLEKLGEWHQTTFADHDKGGNDLFADVLKSKLTREQVEEELLALLKRHCPPQKCSLAGSSIHIDKDVLRRCMPKVHDYLHYRIIDVSSFQAVMRRWAPWMETKIKKKVAMNGPETVNHRAMDDIVWSMSFMKQFRIILNKQYDPNHKNQGPPHHENHGFPNQKNHGPPHHENHGSPHRENHGFLNQKNHDSPHYENQGSPHHENHGSQNPRFRRSVSESQVVVRSELPKIASNIESMELYADERRLIERILFEKKFDIKNLRLSQNWQQIYDANPHLREVFINKERLEKFDKDFTKENRRLTTRIQSSTNQNNTFNPRKHSTTEHWGQRKLLLTEIEFLTNYGTDDDCQVIYAGAAPGSHINYLSSLFPGLEFVLIDDKEFSVDTSSKILIRSERFTNNTAKRFCDPKRKILFICNVRTYRTQGDVQNDGTEDMQNQMDWYKLLKSPVSLLNFRLPRESGNSQYLKGHQMIEPWATRRATECRLLVKKDAGIVNYDHRQFHEDLLRFHSETRIMYYKHNMDDVDTEGLDHCYDCRAEIFILQEYLTKVQRVRSDGQLKTGIADMSRDISRLIDDPGRPKFIGGIRKLNVIPKN